jgi:hypothetical protein
MRFVFGCLLAVMVSVAALVVGNATASTLTNLPRLPSGTLLHKAKIVCGDFGQGYTCRRESGTLRRGKMRQVPSSRSNEPSSDSGGGWFGSGEDDANAVPPAAAQQAPAVPGTCPVNTELLGGHCIPYTQSCNRGMAAGAAPQVGRSADEKLVCSFRSDGLKDCCCRTYSKF